MALVEELDASDAPVELSDPAAVRVPSTAVTVVGGTGWSGSPVAPDFWSTMAAVLAMVSVSVSVPVRSRAAEGLNHVPLEAGGTILVTEAM